jgi:hypothetical protein
MSGISLPVTRPSGRALIVGSDACRAQPLTVLQRLGYQCAEVEDPYNGMIELCRRPLVYRAVILSLASMYREELPLIESIKKRFPHIEVWLCHTDGRHASQAEAQRLGADGLIADDGMHRTAVGAPAPVPTPVEEEEVETESASRESNSDLDEPVLTPDELRALLEDVPSPQQSKERPADN